MRERKRNIGQVLFLTIIFSLVGLIISAGLYYAYERFFRGFFPIKTYTTIREAVAGTVQIIASYIDQCPEDAKSRLECPKGLSEPDEKNCRNGIIRFRLVNERDTFPANATVCLLYPGNPKGGSTESVVGIDIPGARSVKNLIYSITVTAYGPYGVTSTVEAVYQAQ